jgi:hypothetical protein
MIKNHDPKFFFLDGSLSCRIHDKDFKPFDNMDSEEEVPKSKSSGKKL